MFHKVSFVAALVVSFVVISCSPDIETEEVLLEEEAVELESLSEPDIDVDNIPPKLILAAVSDSNQDHHDHFFVESTRFDRIIFRENEFDPIALGNGEDVYNPEVVKRIRFVFNEEITGRIELRTEAEKDLLWVSNIQDPTSDFLLKRGDNTALLKDTAYVVTGTAVDAAGNELEFSIPFDTRGSVFGKWDLVSINGDPPGKWIFDNDLLPVNWRLVHPAERKPRIIKSTLILEKSLDWEWKDLWKNKTSGVINMKGNGLSLKEWGVHDHWEGHYKEDQGEESLFLSRRVRFAVGNRFPVLQMNCEFRRH